MQFVSFLNILILNVKDIISGNKKFKFHKVFIYIYIYKYTRARMRVYKNIHSNLINIKL